MSNTLFDNFLKKKINIFQTVQLAQIIKMPYSVFTSFNSLPILGKKKSRLNIYQMLFLSNWMWRIVWRSHKN